MNDRLRILVVGDGVAAWLTAAVLARRLGPACLNGGVLVKVVPAGNGSHGVGPFGDGLIALPEWQLTDVARTLPADLLRRHAALSHSLGIVYAGWGPGGAAWILPFGDCGAPMGAVAFPQLAARARLAGRRVRLADYSLAALAAQAERYAFPEADRRSARSSLALASHLDANGLAATLRTVALRLGAGEEHVSVRGVEAGPFGLASLKLSDGRELAGDLFVDASGEQRVLGAGRWNSWSDCFPCDAVRSWTETEPAAPPPYALMAAGPDGWRSTVPLSGKRCVTELLSSRGGLLADGAVRFAAGAASEPWRGNLVAVGAGALLVEPLLGTALLTATTAAERLANLLPYVAGSAIEAREYNRLTHQEADRLRDTLFALWRSNGRSGEPLWDAARATVGSDELERKLALYRSRGTIPIEDGELFDAADWALLLDGQGIYPRRHDPMAGALLLDDIDRHLARLRERLIDELRTMPPHAAMLAGTLRPDSQD